MAYPPGPPPNQPGAPPPGYPPPQGYGYPPPGYPPPGYYPPPPKSDAGRTVLIVIACVVGGLVVIGGIVGAIALVGVRRYLDNSKRAEASANLLSLTTGMKACYMMESLDGDHALPESSNPVPASLSAVSGKKYMSVTKDWAQPAFECAHFSLSTPQYFQYRWEKENDRAGKATAVADFDGDGDVDAKFEAEVECTSTGDCTVSPVKEK